MSDAEGEIILYRSDDGEAVVQLRAARGTVWLSRVRMAELYVTTPQNIGQIIARVLADGEVGEATRNSEFLVQPEGSRQVRREVKVYNLDFAEDRAKRRQQTLMADWVAQTDRFLDFNEREILDGTGRVAADDVEQIVAERHAEFDGRRRAIEAEQAAAEEDNDLAELIDIERRNKGTMEDGQ